VSAGELLDSACHAHSIISSSSNDSGASYRLGHCVGSAAGAGFADGWHGLDAVKKVSRDQDSKKQQQQQVGRHLGAGPHHPTPGSPDMHHTAMCVPDEVIVVKLLQELPRLQVLQLYRCRHLQGEGQGLAQHCCGRYSPAAVTYQ
jgi:hypothetical protein